MMSANQESQVHALLQTIRPWFPQDQSFLIDLARSDMKARLLIAITLTASENTSEAEQLFDSIVKAEATADQDLGAEKLRACLGLAHIRMERLKYDEAEDYLWQARNEWAAFAKDEVTREEISLLIAECRFGQGFVQEAVDRAEEVLRKQRSAKAPDEQLAKTYQQLGWFSLHKMDVPGALKHIKTAMRLAPALDQSLVDAALEAEKEGNFEKAVEYYFDSIRFDT